MSYCRFIDADAYVFATTVGGGKVALECCGCFLTLSYDDQPVQFTSTQEMVDHLAAHKAAGDRIPDDVVPALWADDAENFPPACQDISRAGQGRTT